jgi:hypothetical protein
MNILGVSVALVMQHAMSMQHAILSSAACLILPYLVTPFHNQRGVTEHKMCVLSFYTTSAWNISHSKRNLVRCHMCICLYGNYPLFLSDFNST